MESYEYPDKIRSFAEGPVPISWSWMIDQFIRTCHTIKEFDNLRSQVFFPLYSSSHDSSGNQSKLWWWSNTRTTEYVCNPRLSRLKSVLARKKPSLSVFIHHWTSPSFSKLAISLFFRSNETPSLHSYHHVFYQRWPRHQGCVHFTSKSCWRAVCIQVPSSQLPDICHTTHQPVTYHTFRNDTSPPVGFGRFEKFHYVIRIVDMLEIGDKHLLCFREQAEPFFWPCGIQDNPGKRRE